MYNLIKDSAIMSMHLLSAFTINEQRYKKFQNPIRRKSNHTIWWIVPDLQILSKVEIKTTFAKIYSFPSKAH